MKEYGRDNKVFPAETSARTGFGDLASPVALPARHCYKTDAPESGKSCLKPRHLLSGEKFTINSTSRPMRMDARKYRGRMLAQLRSL